MRYVDPNQSGSKVQFKAQYENFIGGQWVAPVKGEYFDNISPVDGKVFTKIPRSSVEDIELALDIGDQTIIDLLGIDSDWCKQCRKIWKKLQHRRLMRG